MTRRRAIVIGCGIGGPVAAMALARAGLEPVIYEAHAKSADYVGTFLNTASNGLDALRALDIDDEVLRAGFPTSRMIMWSGTGKRLGEVQNGEALADGTVSRTIQRGVLHGVLRDEARRRGVVIERGKRLVDADILSKDGVVARFEDGTEARGDLLVGADGIGSRVRTLVDPDAPSARYTGQLSVGGIARGAVLAATPDTFHMIFGARAFFGYTAPTPDEVYWFANVAESVAPTRESLAEISVATWKDRLRALFAGDACPALGLIAATDTLAAYPLFDMPTVPRWHRGAAVLLGDALHATSPSSGQGASMAIEDAIILARCLRDVPEPSDAFALYELTRRARVERVVEYGKRVGSTKVLGPVGRFFRDLVMPYALRRFASSSAQAWLYQHHIDWDAPALAETTR